MTKMRNVDNEAASKLLSKKDIIKLISQHPCFAKLNPKNVIDLAAISIVKKYTAGQIIVSQGNFIDAVYLIAIGKVEVATEIKKNNKIKLVPQTVLKKDEAIGLTATGFFSPTGIRSATITAMSDVILVGWSLANFDTFLKKHSQLSQSMQHASDLMLRMDFIKQAAPFSELSTKHITKLAHNIKEISVTAGTILFHEGEIGAECYLIRSGQVEIFLSEQDGSHRILAILEAPMLFGEMAALTSTPRNATAKIIVDSKLLVLQKKQLQELMHYQPSTAEAIAILSIERSRPIRVANIQSFHQTTADEKMITILKDSVHQRYYQLSSIGRFIWQHLDGRHTIHDITLAIVEKHKVFIPDTIADIIFNLADAGFVILPTIHLLTPPAIVKPKKTKKSLIRYYLYKLIVIHYTSKDLNRIITNSYAGGVHLLFSKVSQIILAAISICGLITFALLAINIPIILTAIQHFVLLIILVIITNIFLSLFHELGHAYTTKAFGYEIHRGGFIFYWIGLFAFVDTSDLWLANPRIRILVNLAGPYVDVILAGLFSIIAWTITIPALSFFFLGTRVAFICQCI